MRQTSLTFSGWSGYTVSRELNPKKYQVVVVSPRSYFAFTPLLASTAVGTLEFRTALEPVRSRRSRVQFFQGWADDVNFTDRTITIEEGVADKLQGQALASDRHEGATKEQRQRERQNESKKGQLFSMNYDKLVISVGCYSQTFDTKGVREHALFLKDVGDARKIRNRLLECFEIAALPTCTDEMRKQTLKFAIVGGGPTGIEFSAELHDLIHEDMARIYPELIKYCQIVVYDVAPAVLSMFDEKLAKYATESFQRRNIAVKTSHHVQELRPGSPSHLEQSDKDTPDVRHGQPCYTLRVKEEGEVGVGMVVWSTGLMMNPFIQRALHSTRTLPAKEAFYDTKEVTDEVARKEWIIKKDSKTGSVITCDKLRILLSPYGSGEDENAPVARMRDVYALGDCAIVEGTTYPATAQVAQQKASWLATRLNKGDIDSQSFHWRNLGVMAYIGNWNAIMQSGGGGNISGRTAWLIWRGAYLTKSVSWRNKILIPTYWLLNWLFGRDISRF